MKILAIEHELPEIQSERFQVLAKQEAHTVWELQQAGLIREAYFRSDRKQAVLVLECDSVAEAQEVLSRLPFVLEGLITFECIPLQPYDGFARLFA